MSTKEKFEKLQNDILSSWDDLDAAYNEIQCDIRLQGRLEKICNQTIHPSSLDDLGIYKYNLKVLREALSDRIEKEIVNLSGCLTNLNKTAHEIAYFKLYEEENDT